MLPDELFVDRRMAMGSFQDKKCIKSDVELLTVTIHLQTGC